MELLSWLRILITFDGIVSIFIGIMATARICSDFDEYKVCQFQVFL